MTISEEWKTRPWLFADCLIGMFTLHTKMKKKCTNGTRRSVCSKNLILSFPMSAILSLIFNLTLLCNHPTASFGIISYMAIHTPHNLDNNLIIISLITITFKLKKWPKRNLYGVLPLTKRYRVPYFCFLLALVIQKYFP